MSTSSARNGSKFLNVVNATPLKVICKTTFGTGQETDCSNLCLIHQVSVGSNVQNGLNHETIVGSVKE